VTHFIPSQVWKNIYKDYKKQFPYSEFHPKSLKDRLREFLKELKIGTSNKQGMKRVTLQSDHVIAQLKTTDGHASRNVLKRHQLMIEGKSSPSFQSFPNYMHNFNPMSDETPRLSSKLAPTCFNF
jgi:hypothetical protein